MDKLAGCALAFEQLLDVQYRMIVGRKGKAAELLIGFSMLDFHHLMGLGKLKDLRHATMNRETVFKEILNSKISYEADNQKPLHPPDRKPLPTYPSYRTTL